MPHTLSFYLSPLNQRIAIPLIIVFTDDLLRYFDSLRIRTVEGRQGRQRGPREAGWGAGREGGGKKGMMEGGKGKTMKGGREVCEPEL